MDLDLFNQAKAKESVKRLESAVEVGMNLLDNIKATISAAKEIPDVAMFMKSIGDVKATYTFQKPIIGVVGSTGAGKSSLINALLDEESLAPTSGMRACTAVITEIQYNHSTDEDEKYRAEVEFIKAAEWEKELRILLDDLSGAGIINIDLNSDSNVAVAYNKLRAVYPNISKDDLLKGKHSAKSLAQDPSVEQLLGSMAKVSASTPETFLELLKKYIDSKEKRRDMSREGEPMEHWPLVKVVRIFTKSPVLDTGLVLVDLPGTQDSNAARSAAAARYIEKCTGLWVIAPINRAVDDTAAQKLMGESFRRQLQVDGAYSAISFICSRTDEISVKETLRAIPEGEKAQATSAKLSVTEPQQKELGIEFNSVEKDINELSKLIESREKDIRTLEAAIDHSSSKEEGKLKFTSTQRGQKRKQRVSAVKARKKTQTMMDNSDGSDDSDSSEDELETSDGESEETLTLADARERLNKLREEQKAAWDEKAELKSKLAPIKTKKKETRDEIKELKCLLEHQCMQFRNQYVTPSIQRQFADGMKELDEDAAFEKDADNFDPEHQQRDYNEVAQGLPVFCVSSSAYQKLSGRGDQDRVFRGFRDLEDTQIPQLRAHAQAMVKRMRQGECCGFLGELSQCLTRLMVQVVLADEPLKMADDLKEMELKFLEASVLRLQENVEASLKVNFERWNDKLKLDILEKFPGAVRYASEQAMESVASWEKPKDEGGLVWSTYRATCVREGVFSGSCGPRDLNRELVAPLMKPFATSWEHVFSKYLPKRIDSAANKLACLLLEFQIDVQKRPAITKTMSYGLVAQQTKSFAEGVVGSTGALKAELSFGQKDASRLFLPPINEDMSSIYAICGHETGKGTFKRMREAMRAFIEQHREEMFQKATAAAERRLLEMMGHIQTTMTRYVRKAADSIAQDHRSLIEGKNIFETFIAVRKEIRDVLDGADERFRTIAEAPDDDSDLPELVASPIIGHMSPAIDLSLGIKPCALESPDSDGVGVKTEPEN